MTKEEVNRIFKGWQEYVEIADKLSKIFTLIPESFLPYPKTQLEEALIIIAKNYTDSGDEKKSDAIKDTMAFWLSQYGNDGDAIESMTKKLNLMSKHPELKMDLIENLKKVRDSWSLSRNKIDSK